MIHIMTNILVKGKTPEQIYQWILDLNTERYRKWHPTDHREFRWITRKEEGGGGYVYFFDELIGNLRLNWKWKVDKVKAPEYFHSKALIPYPTYWAITLNKVTNGTEVIHEVWTGFSFFGVERIFDWIANRFFLTEKNIKALHKHAYEEFTNLEEL